MGLLSTFFATVLVCITFILSSSAAVTSLPQPPFNRFNGFNGNYIIRGTGYYNSNVSTTTTMDEALFVGDEVNQRMLLDLGSGGQYWIFKNETFLILDSTPLLNGRCGYIPNFNYSMQIENYKRAFSVNNLDNVYLGGVWDVASCNYPVAVEMRTQKAFLRGKFTDVLSAWNFQQDYPISFPIGNGTYSNVCLRSDARVKFNIFTLDGYSDRSRYFTLPSVCTRNTPLIYDYCSTVYYPGNQCSPYITDIGI